MSVFSSAYQCPVCQAPLTLDENRWQCINNHSFDRHKKGYVNLLLTQHKRSKAPGDDAQMIARRREFLEAGHYQPLADAIAELLHQQVADDANLLDAGCGEGYYTQQIALKLSRSHCYGLDISKPAIAAASKYKSIEWCVGSSSQPPYLAESFDAIISVFSRVDAKAFQRILRPNGIVVMAAPDHDHLMALRSLIYQEVRPYDTSKHLDYFNNEDFELISDSRVSCTIQLQSNEQLWDLLGMTPHAHRLPSAVREKLAKVAQHTDEACFKLYCWRKKS